MGEMTHAWVISRTISTQGLPRLILEICHAISRRKYSRTFYRHLKRDATSVIVRFDFLQKNWIE